MLASSLNKMMISTLRCGSKMMMFFVTFIITLCFLSKLKGVKSEVSLSNANSLSSSSMQVVESRKQKPLADLFSRFTNDDKKAHLSQGIVIIVFDCYSYLICFITTRSLNNFLSYIYTYSVWLEIRRHETSALCKRKLANARCKRY